MKKFDLKKVLSWLGFILKCPVCSVKYEVSSIKVLSSEQDKVSGETKLLIHSDCKRCKSSVMFNIDISGQDVFTVIAKTDLTSNDNTKFRNTPAISTDDCITIHKSLKKFNGDFIKALKRK